MPVALLYLKLPVLAAILSFFPLYVVALQMLANVAGVVVFGRAFGEPVHWRLVARMPLTYLPYQWLIAFSALRATVRHLRGDREWEKTEHRGAHRRTPAPAPLPQHVPVVDVLEVVRYGLGSEVVNWYLVEEGRLIAVDAGLHAFGGDLDAQLAALGRSVAEVEAMVPTHLEGDAGTRAGDPVVGRLRIERDVALQAATT
jgi:hypothetical protein